MVLSPEKVAGYEDAPGPALQGTGVEKKATVSVNFLKERVYRDGGGCSYMVKISV
jgi:hypothetical protein